MLYVANAFSLSMLNREEQNGTPLSYVPRSWDTPLKTARVPRPVEDPRKVITDHLAHNQEVISVIGHSDTANLFSELLGVLLPTNRVSLSLRPDDRLLVGQYVGPRLPEGAKTLPEGAVIEWWLV